MAKVIYETDLVKITKEEHNPSDITIEYKTNKIDYYPTGCSMTQWNEDCEEITKEVERILNEYNLYNHDRKTNIYNSNQLITVLEILKNIK